MMRERRVFFSVFWWLLSILLLLLLQFQLINHIIISFHTFHVRDTFFFCILLFIISYMQCSRHCNAKWFILKKIRTSQTKRKMREKKSKNSCNGHFSYRICLMCLVELTELTYVLYTTNQSAICDRCCFKWFESEI